MSALIPVRRWRKQFRKNLIFRFVLNDYEKESYCRQLRKQVAAKQLWDETLELVKPGTVCVDCGAHIGEVTFAWATKGAIVHSIEPHPSCYRILQEKFTNFPNVHLYQNAVGIATGVQRLYLENNASHESISQASSLIVSKGNVSESNFIDVEVINLLDFIRRFDTKVDILKMDIEGMEVELLNAMIDRKMQQEVGLIVAELHENIPSLQDDIATLKSKILDQGVDNIRLDWK